MKTMTYGIMPSLETLRHALNFHHSDRAKGMGLPAEMYWMSLVGKDATAMADLHNAGFSHPDVQIGDEPTKFTRPWHDQHKLYVETTSAAGLHALLTGLMQLPEDSDDGEDDGEWPGSLVSSILYTLDIEWV